MPYSPILERAVVQVRPGGDEGEPEDDLGAEGCAGGGAEEQGGCAQGDEGAFGGAVEVRKGLNGEPYRSRATSWLR